MRAFENNKKATGLPLWLLYIKKPWDPHQSPMAFHPHIGNGLMGDSFQNKSRSNKNQSVGS
jgi:hypothetical protein